jgi:insulysin
MLTSSPADIDAAALEALTKKDMVDFYAHFISTSSTQRAKISVHLQAQGKAKEPSLNEKKTAAVAAVKIILTEHQITSNDDVLQERISQASSTDGIADQVAALLSNDLKLDTNIAAKVLDEAKAALGVADSGLPAEPQALDETADVQSVIDASQPVLIKDVHAWRASMQISTGVRPVRNLEEFVEVAEKL